MTVKHGTRYGYAKQKCRCVDCTKAQSTYTAEYYRKNKVELSRKARARYYEKHKHDVKALSKPVEEILIANKLLRDGASYAEVARTVGWDIHTVARHFPGRGWTRQQVGSYGKLMYQLGKYL